eukprot:CAMPEP_0172021466 /NCGR_PEP_ID=MMETSP1041-20130122/13725_1 /TAXON_ID=464988 /ORGANISM="Hemiselmis andersenii, Strain CCMP439" /LENGTH=81 /DNA_ID=CAMNT_0012676789 /DNA_START=1 /DNA_END=246 /DNA_ORIENTATION=+
MMSLSPSLVKRPSVGSRSTILLSRFISEFLIPLSESTKPRSVNTTSPVAQKAYAINSSTRHHALSLYSAVSYARMPEQADT